MILHIDKFLSSKEIREPEAVKQNIWILKKGKSQWKGFCYSSIIPGVELQPGTDSKDFPKVKQGEEQKERQMQQSWSGC